MSALPNPLAGYDDIVGYLRDRPRHEGSVAGSRELADVLGVPALPAGSRDLRVEREHRADGLVTSTLSWDTGFGPRTRGYLVRQADRDNEVLPGVLALHCHGGYKWLGAEQLVDLGDDAVAEAAMLQGQWYGGRAPATELARQGFAVLAPDTFAWGSRRFPLEQRTPKLAAEVAAQEALWREQGFVPSAAERYNAAASAHEDTVAKAAGVLGSSLAGLVIHDDLVSLGVLGELPGVDADRLGCFGFSGGGGRAVLLSALDRRVKAAVVACMMATNESLTPDYLDTHSWLFNSPGLWRYSEWPLLVRGASVLVQYGETDALFPLEGMRVAHEMLSKQAPGRYRGEFYPGGHDFGTELQLDAFAFLAEELASTESR